MKLRIIELDPVTNSFIQTNEVIVDMPEGCEYIKGYEISSRLEGGYMVCGTSRETSARSHSVFIYTFSDDLQSQVFVDYDLSTGPFGLDPDIDEMGGDVSSGGHFFAGGVRYRFQSNNYTDFYVVFEPNRFATLAMDSLQGHLDITQEQLDHMRAIRVETISLSGSSYRIILEDSNDMSGSVSVFDIAGREIRRLHSPSIENENAIFLFDGRDSNGILLPEGVYLFVPCGLGIPGAAHPVLRN